MRNLYRLMVYGLFALMPALVAADEPSIDSAKTPVRQLFSGKVQLLGEVLKRRDISFTEEVAGQAVLETDAGEIIPILADWRGRAFFQDERLRNRPVDLVGFRRPGLPYLQVLMVFTFDDSETRMFTDYWCDICSIAMYEIKPCECCQGDTRLRFQKQDLPVDVQKKSLLNK